MQGQKSGSDGEAQPVREQADRAVVKEEKP